MRITIQMMEQVVAQKDDEIKSQKEQRAEVEALLERLVDTVFGKGVDYKSDRFARDTFGVQMQKDEQTPSAAINEIKNLKHNLARVIAEKEGLKEIYETECNRLQKLVTIALLGEMPKEEPRCPQYHPEGTYCDYCANRGRRSY